MKLPQIPPPTKVCTLWSDVIVGEEDENREENDLKFKGKEVEVDVLGIRGRRKGMKT